MHHDLTCWICEINPAAWVVEGKTQDETETHHQLACDDFSCLCLSEAWANTGGLRLTDVRALTRSEARVISGLELDEVTT